MATSQHVIFKLDKEEYGLDIMKVNGIEKHQEVVKVPNSPEYIEGVINLRGEVLPIFSLRKKFNLAEREINEQTKIVVVFLNDLKVGFVVDEVSEILYIDDEQIEAAPKLITGINRRYIKSIAKIDGRMIVLVDIDLILDDEEKLSLGEIVDEDLAETASSVE